MLRLGTILLLFCAAVLARNIVRREPTPPLPPVRVSVPSSYVRLVSLSFDGLAADILWIRFLQQLPMRPADDSLGRSLAAQLQSVVELDPEFRVAHLQGSVLLSVLGNQHCAALDIAERGAKRFPEDWRLHFQAGYICFAELRDSGCAARHMRAAAADPGAPQWLPRLVGRLLAEDSQLDAAIEYLAGQAQRNADPRVQEHTLERLKEALLTRELERLDGAIRAFQLQHGGIPLDWESIVSAGLLPDVPGADPFGGRLEIGPDGRARSSTGRSGLRTFRVEDGYLGTTGEKITEERVVARLEQSLGKPSLLFGKEDRIRAAAGDPSSPLHALETLREVQPDRSKQIRLLEARVILRDELARLRAAYVRLLRRDPAGKPSIVEVAREAGVSPHDPFGDSYVFDESGQPAPARGREPIAIVRGLLAERSAACP